MMGLLRTIKNKKSPGFSMENNMLLLKELIRSFDGKRNPIQVFSAKELAKATCNYDPNLIILRDCFYDLYKGNYGASHSRAILVKKTKHKDKELTINELVVTSQINHKNVVKLLGCCLETELPILVFEYCHANGTLADRIHLKSSGNDDGRWRRPLTWESRLRIATEIADAITYLHTFTSRPIIHRDIKTLNIALDEQDVARLLDFSLCILIPSGQTQVEMPVAGTLAYMDPEYLANGQESEKVDVYSFGIVLREIFTGEKNLIQEADWVTYERYLSVQEDKHISQNVLDPRIEEEVSNEQLEPYAKLVWRCTRENGDERPEMIEVAKELRRIWKTIQSH